MNSLSNCLDGGRAKDKGDACLPNKEREKERKGRRKKWEWVGERGEGERERVSLSQRDFISPR